MCGIYGVFSPGGQPLKDEDSDSEMAAALRHRGPDSSGLLRSPSALLGVERLRIVDPSARADQPFTDLSGKIWLGANGEIFNSPALRNRFGRYQFRSQSDVEVALPAYLAGDLPSLDGQFAIVVWDTPHRRLTLMRDRAGEKPLFYTRTSTEIVVASEIAALLAYPAVSPTADSDGVAEFLTRGYTTGTRTVFEQIKRVEPGTIVTIDVTGVSIRRYWHPQLIDVCDEDDARAVNSLDALLVDAVRRQSADVRPGVFLSGGLDSSLITALLARDSDGPVRTYSVSFSDAGYDESRQARAVSRLLRTEHKEISASDDELCRALEHMTELSAEPLPDPALLPTFLLSEVASRDTRVVMGGEGADELFGGYPTYLGHRLAEAVGSNPAVGIMARSAARFFSTRNGPTPVGRLLNTFAESAKHPWLQRHTEWFRPCGTHFSKVPSGPSVSEHAVAQLGPESGPMMLDYMQHLPGQLLTKIDRATMACSLEARSPFLDRALTEFALSRPGTNRVRRLTTKWLLKHVARRYLPEEIASRRKHGFSVPVSRLINGPLRAEVDRLLGPEAVRGTGFMHTAILSQQLYEHRERIADHGRSLWTAFVFQRWFERWVTGDLK